MSVALWCWMAFASFADIPELPSVGGEEKVGRAVVQLHLFPEVLVNNLAEGRRSVWGQRHAWESCREKAINLKQMNQLRMVGE